MEQDVFKKKLNELVKEIQSRPTPQNDKLITLAKQANQCHDQLKKSIGTLQESLDYLSVSVKYMVFDLEATRRENEHLRKLVEDKND